MSSAGSHEFEERNALSKIQLGRRLCLTSCQLAAGEAARIAMAPCSLRIYLGSTPSLSARNAKPADFQTCGFPRLVSLPQRIRRTNATLLSVPRPTRWTATQQAVETMT